MSSAPASTSPGSPLRAEHRHRGALVAWALLIAYASLYPFGPLRLPGADAGAACRPRDPGGIPGRRTIMFRTMTTGLLFALLAGAMGAADAQALNWPPPQIACTDDNAWSLEDT